MEQQTEQLFFDFENVQPHIVQNVADEIKLELGEFAGPLDLLLFLIKQEQANIFDIPIARITDEYLKYVRLTLFSRNNRARLRHVVQVGFS